MPALLALYMGHHVAALIYLAWFLTYQVLLWNSSHFFFKCQIPKAPFLPAKEEPLLLWAFPPLNTGVLTLLDTHLSSPLDSAKRAMIWKHFSNAWNKETFSNQKGAAVGIIHVNVSEKSLNHSGSFQKSIQNLKLENPQNLENAGYQPGLRTLKSHQISF